MVTNITCNRLQHVEIVDVLFLGEEGVVCDNEGANSGGLLFDLTGLVLGVGVAKMSVILANDDATAIKDPISSSHT